VTAADKLTEEGIEKGQQSGEVRAKRDMLTRPMDRAFGLVEITSVVPVLPLCAPLPSG